MDRKVVISGFLYPPRAQNIGHLFSRANAFYLSKMSPRSVLPCLNLLERLGHLCWTKLPHVCLHTNTVKLVFAQIRKPKLNRFGIAVFDLNQAPQSHTFKVLLRLLENEVTPGHGPSLCDSG